MLINVFGTIEGDVGVELKDMDDHYEAAVQKFVNSQLGGADE